jgi:hypothetical protein
MAVTTAYTKNLTVPGAGPAGLGRLAAGRVTERLCEGGPAARVRTDRGDAAEFIA